MDAIKHFYTDTENWGTPQNWDEAKVALKTNVKYDYFST